MTTPPPPPPGWQPPGEPVDPNAVQWGAPLPPPPPPPAYSTDPFPTPALGDASAYPPPGQWEPLSTEPPTTPRRAGRGRMIAAAITVAALVGGGVVTYMAVSDSSKSGASSPRAAIETIVKDLNKSDLLGVLDDLAPGERTAIVTPFTDAVNELKRTKVLSGAADPSSVTGVESQISGLTFDSQTIKINDHVEIVKITGGTIHLSSDARKVPFTKEFIDAAFPNGVPSNTSDSTFDIAKMLANGGHAQVAAQKVGGKWYPSLFYTIANGAANGEVPAASDYIAPVGSSSPDLVVRHLFENLQQGKWHDLIALVSPDELGVLHDYGGLLLKDGVDGNPLPFTVRDFNFDVTSANGGGKRVVITEITVGANGETTTVKVDGGCYAVTNKGETKKLCSSDLTDIIVSALDGLGISESDITPAQRAAIEDVTKGLSKVGGFIVTQTNGQWYLNPVRTVLDEVPSLLSNLKSNDILEIIKLAQGH